MLPRVVVTGLGAVSPLGIGVQRNWTNLIAGKCGISALNGEEYAALPSRVAGQVPETDKLEASITSKNGRGRSLPLFIQYALNACGEALGDAQIEVLPDSPSQNIAVIIGSGMGGLDTFYDNATAFQASGYRKVSPMFVPNLLVNMAAGHVSIKYKLHGPQHTVATACATGANAIGDAYNFIRLGMTERAVCGAFDALIHPLTIAGFARARALSTNFNETPEKASRPFDDDRDGFVLGEGGGIVVLETLESAVERNAPIYAEVVGYGLSGDAHHITAPPADGAGATRAMRMALEMSSIDPKEVGYVNAHATSTPLGDAIEAHAIASVLTDNVAVSSTKGATGHLLGGAGALEAIYTILSLEHGLAPPSLNIDKTEVPLSNIIKSTTPIDTEYALTNSFGFGGVNSSLLFKKWHG